MLPVRGSFNSGLGSFCLCVYSYIALRDFPTRLFIFFLNSFPPLLWKKVGGFFLRFLAIKEEEKEVKKKTGSNVNV